ncbi:putative cinnamyl alcohol dehydrogenase 1 [Camellia lanceoleosa]|uniref:Cinnamyl alcohol dehydrogenase 1 n=1 Tax=Camellia lanceoleosa TaxID=1840588 RepID=A0ACC0F0V7_9ERIC|nr:putative cinnamyl alcohol dehydrogenase 1 [Camellia lanceoleosa]
MKKCRAVESNDVSLKITHCGVCYADVVWTRNKLGVSQYPLLPGHEIAGIVKEVGSNVHHFKVGDHYTTEFNIFKYSEDSPIGTYVNSCRDCEYCGMDMDAYCSKGPVRTFNSVDVDGTITKGGYSSYIVVHQRYYFRIPNDYPLAAAPPLLCAGIIVYSPMMRHKTNQPSKSLGVIGLGGLGHLAVKFGKAFGLSVTVFSTNITKKDKALNKLGADKFLISSDKEQMKSMVNSLNFIIDTASGDHPFDSYMKLLKTGGTLVLVGGPSEVKLNPTSLIVENAMAKLGRLLMYEASRDWLVRFLLIVHHLQVLVFGSFTEDEIKSFQRQPPEIDIEIKFGSLDVETLRSLGIFNSKLTEYDFSTGA